MAAPRVIAIVGLAAVQAVVIGASAHAAPPVPAAPEVHGPATIHIADERLDEMPVDIRPADVGAIVDADTAASTRSVRTLDATGAHESGPITGAQVALTNATTWHTAGITGAGVKVGVIDFFDVTRFWNVAEHGPVPVSGVTARCFEAGADCTGLYYDGIDDGGDDHGVAVVEVVKDMAPDAQIYIGTVFTVNDYRRLIDWFATEGVAVVNRSLGSRYDGPGDGRGNLDDIAAYANSLGITWVNSGGNNGDGRYYRHPVRLAGTRVAFGPAGSSTMLPFNGCVALGGVRWANDWDVAPARRTDYDIYLWDAPTGDPGAGVLVDASEGDQRAGDVPIEMFDLSRCPSGSDRALYLEVRWRGGDTTGDVLEILDYGNGMAAYTQAAYSAATPIADSREPGVLAVGAVDPPGSGSAAIYSSQGPTNDGRVSPDVSAPSGFTSTIFMSGFSGTSAAAPVVAGGAALLLQAGLAADPASLGNLVRHLSVDRGAPGADNQFGSGEFQLPAPPTELTPTPSRFEGLPAAIRVLDTRPTTPVGPSGLIGAVDAGEIVDLPLGAAIPGDATAVAVNVTSVEIDRPSFTQVLPTLRAPVGGYSNLNVDATGQTRANFAIVPVGADGSISLYTTGGGHLVVDLLGSFRDAPDAVASGRFVELPTPERVLDTREGAPAGPLYANQTRSVPWPAGVDRSQVAALVVTVTGTDATAPGWIQAYPGDRPDVIASTSTVNLTSGATVANTAIVPIGTSGTAVTGYFANEGSAHVVVDVIGYITSAGAPSAESGRYVPVRPGRAYDRAITGELVGGQQVVIDADAAPGSSVPPDAAAVVWNLAPIAVRQPGFGRTWAADAPQPETSSFNFSVAGEVRAASVVSAVDGGRARVVLSNGTSDATPIGALIADVFGYFT